MDIEVEVAVEKELGLASKKDIEAYGIREFNERCRALVLRHVDAFEVLTERMGYWVDTASAYLTMNPSYIESVWWSLKVIFDKGLLVRDFRISPYCPRCGTPLSDHELGQPDVYQVVTDPSVTVRFPLLTLPDGADPRLQGADLLVWTTTPWTLVSNTAVAVHPDETYVVARNRGGADRVVVAEALLGQVLGEDWDIAARVSGAESGSQLPSAVQPDRDPRRAPGRDRGVCHHGGWHRPRPPRAGLRRDDMETGKAHGLPVVNPIQPDGRFESHVPLVGGMFFKDADPPLAADLDRRGLLFRAHPHEHSYPHCWRCGTPLLYYAQPSWYIRTTAIKDELLAENEKTNWQRPTISTAVTASGSQ